MENEQWPVGLAASAGVPIASYDQIDAQWCLRFLRAVRDVAMATVDSDGAPNVRIIDIMMVKDGRPCFLVPRGKEVHAELCANPAIALVAQSTDYRMCRLRGVAERVEDERENRALIDEMFACNPEMNELYEGERRYICDAFVIASGEGEFFDLGQKPVLRKPFSFGGSELSTRDVYHVTSACIGCGTCVAACPTQCISMVEGAARIDPAHCMRCGICLEACPADAIAVS